MCCLGSYSDRYSSQNWNENVGFKDCMFGTNSVVYLFTTKNTIFTRHTICKVIFKYLMRKVQEAFRLDMLFHEIITARNVLVIKQTLYHSFIYVCPNEVDVLQLLERSVLSPREKADSYVTLVSCSYCGSLMLGNFSSKWPFFNNFS